jgi:hypothetical protein
MNPNFPDGLLGRTALTAGLLPHTRILSQSLFESALVSSLGLFFVLSRVGMELLRGFLHLTFGVRCRHRAVCIAPCTCVWNNARFTQKLQTDK